MAADIFQLSELKEFGLILQEQNKDAFVRHFADYIKTLLSAKMFQNYCLISPSMIGVDMWGMNPSADSFAWGLLDFNEHLQFKWAWLKNKMAFTPDLGRHKLVAADFRTLQRCRAHLFKMADRGLWYLFCHWRRYRFIVRCFRRADKELTFQDLFSVAVTQFVAKGWGKSDEFKRLLSAL